MTNEFTGEIPDAERDADSVTRDIPVESVLGFRNRLAEDLNRKKQQLLARVEERNRAGYGNQPNFTEEDQFDLGQISAMEGTLAAIDAGLTDELPASELLGILTMEQVVGQHPDEQA